MWVPLLSAVPAILAAAAGVLVTLNARREVKAKVAVSPLDVTGRALEIANVWIDNLARDNKAMREEMERMEADCDRRISNLEHVIERLQSRAWGADPRTM